eukprot:CAMPEP_0170185886 /NCGR_PEP_ID=MMETSP0040_2-20121228/37741_1 /TAXON_ID=641309 /ORGANISM="Lotharella oceanica, Strain CCMP622" /LENGTH=73 /DNA_ID=CAMNT_0010432437 /DNA_START=936 /DNA_END=1153 /DNA_ORIENTATION=+
MTLLKVSLESGCLLLFNEVVDRTAKWTGLIRFYMLQAPKDSLVLHASLAVTVKTLPPPLELVEHYDEFLRLLR